jgi:hypothetical protein
VKRDEGIRGLGHWRKVPGSRSHNLNECCNFDQLFVLTFESLRIARPRRRSPCEQLSLRAALSASARLTLDGLDLAALDTLYTVCRETPGRRMA